jgi:hypothetical protein
MPSKELAEKEIRAAEGIWAGRKLHCIAAHSRSWRAILLGFVRLAHNSVPTPTAEKVGVRGVPTGNALKDNLHWHLTTSTTT